MEKELEVKVLNLDFNELEKKVLDLDGKLMTHEKQKNILIDSNNNPINSYLNGYLRIRETKNIDTGEVDRKLTLKKQTKEEGLRVSKEYHTDIGNIENTLIILKELGFDNIEYGYKERKSYLLQKARLDFDVWDDKTYPYPYLEIEVENKKHLNNILSLLEIDYKNVTTKSIKELQKELKL